jgi:hypothetical protein
VREDERVRRVTGAVGQELVLRHSIRMKNISRFDESRMKFHAARAANPNLCRLAKTRGKRRELV